MFIVAHRQDVLNAVMIYTDKWTKKTQSDQSHKSHGYHLCSCNSDNHIWRFENKYIVLLTVKKCFLNNKGEKIAETRFETHSFLDGYFDMWRKEISIKIKGNIFPSDFFVNILMEHFDLIWKILTSLCCDVSVRLPSNANPYKETGRILHSKWLWVQIRAVFCKLSRVNGRLGDQGESISLYEVKYLVPPFKDWNIFSNMALNDYYLPSDLYSLVNHAAQNSVFAVTS